MRFLRFPTLIRTLYAFTSINRARASQLAPSQTNVLRSMPSIPLLGSFFSSSSSSANKMSFPDSRSDDEWRAVLNPEQFRILREKGTEYPGSGEFVRHYRSEGVYTCAGCEAPLYKADTKFDAHCGWPAYFDSIPGAVTRRMETDGTRRTEIVCSNCGGHLGHLFKGEPFPTPTKERHCVNSVSLKFSPDDKVVQKGDEAKESKA